MPIRLVLSTANLYQGQIFSNLCYRRVHDLVSQQNCFVHGWNQWNDFSWQLTLNDDRSMEIDIRSGLVTTEIAGISFFVFANIRNYEFNMAVVECMQRTRLESVVHAATIQLQMSYELNSKWPISAQRTTCDDSKDRGAIKGRPQLRTVG